MLLGEQGHPEHLLWALILGHLVFAGPGPLSLDGPIDRRLRRDFPEYTGKPAFSLEGCPDVVIVGAGFGRVRLSGGGAWWLWGVVHVLFLLGGRNRLAVVTNWVWSYVSYRSSTRLITGPVDEPATPEAMPTAAE